MEVRKQGKQAKGKGRGTKGGKNQAIVPSTPFPLFAIGSFLLPLFIPVPSPPKPLEK